MLVATAGTSHVALACPADTDGDGVCDAADNCPAISNPNQSDLDVDTLGDSCDDADAELNVTRLELKHDFAQSASDTSLYRVKGDILLAPSESALSAANGLAIHVRDSLETAVAHAWTPGECATSPSGNIRCVSADRTARILLTRIRAPLVYKYTVKVRRAELPDNRAFIPPVAVTLTNDLIDRVGSIVDCRASNAGLSCREF